MSRFCAIYRNSKLRGSAVLPIAIVFCISLCIARERWGGREGGRWGSSPDSIGKQSSQEAQKLLMLTTQRSGSTWLSSSLNSPSSKISGELMIHYSWKNASVKSSVMWEEYLQDLNRAFQLAGNQSDYAKVHDLDVLKNASWVETKINLIGFKLMYDQIPYHLLGKFVNHINENNILVVHLIRDATLLKLLSRLEQSGPPHVSNESEVKERTANLDLTTMRSEILKRIDSIPMMETEVRFFSSLISSFVKTRTIEIVYEDVSGPFGNYYLQTLFQFLGIDFGSKFTSGLQKIHNLDCDVVLPDWDRIAQIRGTKSEIACYKLRRNTSKLESTIERFLDLNSSLKSCETEGR